MFGEKLARGQHKKAFKNQAWIEEQNGDGEWNGRIRMLLASQAEVERLHAHLHGMPVWTGHSWITLSVSNMFPFTTLGSTTKTGRGGPGNRAPAAAL